MEALFIHLSLFALQARLKITDPLFQKLDLHFFLDNTRLLIDKEVILDILDILVAASLITGKLHRLDLLDEILVELLLGGGFQEAR